MNGELRRRTVKETIRLFRERGLTMDDFVETSFWKDKRFRQFLLLSMDAAYSVGVSDGMEKLLNGETDSERRD